MKNPKFIPGLRLSELFYKQIIKPALRKNFPQLKYSAAIIGEGSEVLGYDDIESADHCWGPRIMLFLEETDYPKYHKEILKQLTAVIPDEFMGFKTNFDCRIKDTVDVFTVRSFFRSYLRIDPYEKLTVSGWLRLSSQKLLEITSGKIYHDGLNLKQTLKKFSYYPHDIWLYILSCQWIKISQEEAFAGRCAFRKDELGSRVVASRLIKDIMKLCFMMEKRYFPYSKWFGTSFKELKCAKKLSPVLEKAVSSTSWKQRQEYLVKAYKTIASLHNSLKITKPLPVKASKYYDRPYLVIHGDVFANAIRDKIKDKEIKSIKTNIGSVDQFMDSTDALSYPDIFSKVNLWE